MGRRLPRALQRWAGTNGIDPHMGGQGLRAGLRQRPKTHLGQSIAHEFRRQFLDALINHVHNQPLRYGLARRIESGGRHLGCKALHQHERRAQIRFHMPVPTAARPGLQRVIFKDRRIVNQDAQRPAQPGDGPRNQGCGLRFVQQIGLHRHGAPPHRRNLRHNRCGVFARAGIMHRHIIAALRQRQRHRPAQPLARPRHQCPHVQPFLQSQPFVPIK